MNDKKDHSKLQKFVEAAVTNPRHPVYRLGMQHSPILQHYAVNVRGMGLLETIEPAAWFEQYPDYTARLEQVMALCEAGDETPETPAAETPVAEADGKMTPAQMKKRVAEMKAEMDRMMAMLGNAEESEESAEAEAEAETE